MLNGIEAKEVGLGETGCWWVSQFLRSQPSHSLKTHGIGFSASPLGGKSWELLTSFGVKAAGLSLCVSEWSQPLIAKGKWSENTLCPGEIDNLQELLEECRKVTVRLCVKLSIHTSLARLLVISSIFYKGEKKKQRERSLRWNPQ